jgi:hemerythrin-like domain-containing protein
MDAIKLLEQQHHEVEELFRKVDKTSSANVRLHLFEQIGDSLAVHCTIEEKIFYPAVFAAKTKDILLEATEEHLGAKRLIADLLALAPTEEHYKAKLTVLKEQILHHVDEERKELFPKARKLLGKDELAMLGEKMEAMADKIKRTKKAPRMGVPAETKRAAAVH